MSDVVIIKEGVVERMERQMLELPQANIPLDHSFSDGVYCRTVRMPAETLVIGHRHKTRHLNIVSTGRALVSLNGEIRELVAPCIFESDPGVRKVLLIVEEMVYSTVHVTSERDLDKLEEALIEKSAPFVEHQLKLEAQKLREAVNSE